MRSQFLTGQNTAITSAILALLAIPASARADAVTDWNAIAVQAAVTAARPGPSGVVDLALVQAAVHDAVQAIEKRYRPYHADIPGAGGSSSAAAATAAHDMLVSRFPAQAASLDMTYQQYLSSHGLAATDPGVQVGATAAAGIIARRASDGSFPDPPPPPFMGGMAAGAWRPTLPGNLAMAAPWLGRMTPFVLTAPSQFRAPPPPALTSDEYVRDYNEVKTLGALEGSTRTAEQTDLAYFWAGNYMVVLNQILRDIAGAQVTNIADSARLFALADLAIADALITAWDSKNQYSFWRPITAIREGDGADPRTAADPAWMPLVTTPNYPDHTSGANNVTAATTGILALFFGKDEMSFSVTTTNVGPTMQDTRSFGRFSEVEKEVVVARIYEGIHFRFADEAGRKQGNQIASHVFMNVLQPVAKGPAADKGDDRSTGGGCRFTPGRAPDPVGLVALLLLGVAVALGRRGR